MTRRELLYALTSAAALQARTAAPFPLAMEAYIFQQYAQRQKKTLREVLPEVIPLARQAGFRNIELNREFLLPDVAPVTLGLIRANQLSMPSVYVGGPMVDDTAARATISEALRIADLCRPFGCKAVVHNADPKSGEAEKSDGELRAQSANFNRMAEALHAQSIQLRIHNHTPEMANGAREWHDTLAHTDPQLVTFCLDLDWAEQGGEDPLALLKEAGKRVTEIHVRSSQNKLWLESLSEGDIDYRRVAAYLREANLQPLVVVELAYRPHTVVTQPLGEDLRRSRIYAEQIFG
jgi:inosose dehydratase